MIGIALAAALATPSAATPLTWLVGRWCTTEAKGVRTCETWGPPAAGRMQGKGRTTRNGKAIETERMLIRLDGGKAAYDASPNGAPTVTFVQVSRGAAAIAFENRGHDYPQRIRYWREGKALVAEISLADGRKPMRWRYQRMR